MGKVFSIDNDTKQIVQDVLDDLLVEGSQGGFGKRCLLVYPPRAVPCSNCLPDPVTGKKRFTYRTGGPVPFPNGMACPLCNADGMRHEEASEEIVLKLTWEPKFFTLPIKNLDLSVPNSVVETKGYLSDLPKLLRVDHLVADLPIAPFIRQKFRLHGEPGVPGNIVQARYVQAVWVRWNG